MPKRREVDGGNDDRRIGSYRGWGSSEVCDTPVRIIELYRRNFLGERSEYLQRIKLSTRLGEVDKVKE